MNPPKTKLNSKIKIPQRYIPRHLTRKDKSIVRKNLTRSRNMYKKNKYFVRPKVKSFKSRKSNHLNRLKKIYGVDNASPSKELAKKTKCSVDALKKIVKKGEGAYLSSGSRPNQTPHSWGLARLASSLTGGNASVVDYHVLEEGCKPTSKALKLAKKQCKKVGRKCGNNKTKNKKYKKNKTKKIKGGNNDECPICMVKFNDGDETYICNKSTDANGNVINHVFHTDCIQGYCITMVGPRRGNTFNCPICRAVNDCPPAPRALPPPFPQEVMPTNAPREHPFFPYTHLTNDTPQQGNEGVITGPMSHFINNEGENVYTTPISNFGNRVSLSVIANSIWQSQEAGILLEENVTRDNFDNLWIYRDLCETTTYGHWLIHNRDDILEMAGERRRTLEEKINIMMIDDQFSRRRLYNRQETLDLFDGESHRYLGNAHDGDLSQICEYIYDVVHTPYRNMI